MPIWHSPLVKCFAKLLLALSRPALVTSWRSALPPRHSLQLHSETWRKHPGWLFMKEHCLRGLGHMQKLWTTFNFPQKQGKTWAGTESRRTATSSAEDTEECGISGILLPFKSVGALPVSSARVGFQPVVLRASIWRRAHLQALATSISLRHSSASQNNKLW